MVPDHAQGDLPTIRLRGVVVRYPFFALGPLDLEVAPGTTLGLLGANGAGKSTLLRTLLGLVLPDAGAVELLGLPMPARQHRIVIGNVLGEREKKTLAFTLSLPVSPRELVAGKLLSSVAMYVACGLFRRHGLRLPLAGRRLRGDGRQRPRVALPPRRLGCLLRAHSGRLPRRFRAGAGDGHRLGIAWLDRPRRAGSSSWSATASFSSGRALPSSRATSASCAVEEPRSPRRSPSKPSSSRLSSGSPSRSTRGRGASSDPLDGLAPPDQMLDFATLYADHARDV